MSPQLRFPARSPFPRHPCRANQRSRCSLAPFTPLVSLGRGNPTPPAASSQLCDTKYYRGHQQQKICIHASRHHNNIDYVVTGCQIRRTMGYTNTAVWIHSKFSVTAISCSLLVRRSTVADMLENVSVRRRLPNSATSVAMPTSLTDWTPGVRGSEAARYGSRMRTWSRRNRVPLDSRCSSRLPIHALQASV